MNWGAIKNEVYFRLGDENKKFWNDAELLTYFGCINSDIIAGSEGNLKIYSFPLVSGQRAYALPTDMYELRGVRINGQKMFGTTPFQMQDLDVSFLTTVGTPGWYYTENPRTICFYPAPTWTPSFYTFDASSGMISGEFGELAYVSTAVMSSEFGVVIDIVDDGAQTARPQFDSRLGVVCAVDANEYICEISYVYSLPDPTDDTSEISWPVYMQWALIYGLLQRCFAKEGQTKNPTLEQFWGSRFEELRKEWFSRNKEWAKGQDMMLSQQPLSWGSDLAWRQRIWP